MQPVLMWIQDLPLSTWVAESDSLWGYAFMLFVHAVGMGLTAGVAFVVCLRMLGVGRAIPVSSMRVLFRLFWVGFYMNLATGVVLFMTDATGIARVPELYIKLVLLGLGIFAVQRLRAFVDSDRSDGQIPRAIRQTAVACIVVWLGVITAGRLIAYAVESNGSAVLIPSVPDRTAAIR
jgi:hypothetical protein